MARMKTAELQAKQSLAYTLFVENGFEQKFIAEKMGVSEKSISKWKTEGKWDDDREEARTGISKRRKRLLATLDNMLDVIEQRKAPGNVPDSKETDALNKLTSAIQKLETELSLAHKTETGKQFVSYMQKVHGKDVAVLVMDYWHEFIMATA
jgi:transposase